ncbi:MAG: flagellar basal-body MS-ring/collar protein FliF [Candidatus Kapabacteria bacterium]|nr:flagellar basal-body MS-ring/collar protein FliF [Candidatus Kapabacteria bacterium]
MAKTEIIEQAKGFYQKLGRWQKVTIFSVLGVLVLGIGMLLYSTREKKEYAILFTDLDEKSASSIVENLKSRQVDYQIDDEGKTILVAKETVYDERMELAKEGLPAEGGVGYEIFDKTNLGMSEFVQKLNYRRALEGELARTISAMNEIKTAKVNITIPEKTLFEKDKKEPTAAITLFFKNGQGSDRVSIVGIQNLVASSVEGLLPGAVTVVDHRGKILSPEPLDDKSVTGMTSKQYMQQREVEENITQKVQTLLDGVLGYGNSEVRVSAELDFTQSDKTITDFDPEEQVVRSEQNITDNSKSSDSLSYPAVNMEKGVSNQIANYEISKTVQRVIEGVGNVKRLTVAVLINGTNKITTHSDGTQTSQYIKRTNEEINKLTDIVKNAVGFDPTRNDQVYVENIPFETQLTNQNLITKKPVAWYQDKDNWQLFALIVVMMLTVLMIYRLLQSKYVKERFRIAMALPKDVTIEDEIEEDELEEAEDELEDIDFGDEDLLLMPAELPEQLLLDGERSETSLEDFDETMNAEEDMDLAALASTSQDDVPELTEENLLKLEIKHKVEDYVTDEPLEAVKLVRMLLAQDVGAI